MKTLREYATIKNLNTDKTTVVDDEGNIEDLDGGSLDIFGGEFDEESRDPALRPDGSHDGLDDLDNQSSWDDMDPFAADSMDGMQEPDFDGVAAPEETDQMALDDESLDDGQGLGDDSLEGIDGEQPPEDPDFQGVIRTVKGACLVYKRRGEEGTFEELWIFNVGKNMRNEMKIRRLILAGTDIQPNDISSQDGTQHVESTTVGNVQYLRVTGLPN